MTVDRGFCLIIARVNHRNSARGLFRHVTVRWIIRWPFDVHQMLFGNRLISNQIFVGADLMTEEIRLSDVHHHRIDIR